MYVSNGDAQGLHWARALPGCCSAHLILQTDILRDSLHPILKRLAHQQGGFNIFRRYRLTHIETTECSKSLELFFAKTLADCGINNIAAVVSCDSPQLWPTLKPITWPAAGCQNSVITPIMLGVLWLALGSLLRIFRNRQDLIFENFVLRQQLTVLKRRRPRPALNLFDKFFWVAISRLWSRWKQTVIIVTPETVVRWHRAAFRMYWMLISRVRDRLVEGRRRRSCGS